ncbi:unnamed protein product [Lactuca saligna]|nr:unnamed protein product [Lactuca saligna]
MVVACSKLGDIKFTRQPFEIMLDRDVIAWNAMKAGYVRFGEPLNGLELFNAMEMKEKNVYTWSGAVGGLAMHGYGKEYLDIFSVMQQENIAPKEDTFLSILKACSVAGLVEDGWKHSESMTKE